MKITEAVAGFNRLIGYKTNSTDLQQARGIALDGVFFSGVPTYPTANQTEAEQNLKFDEHGVAIKPPAETTADNVEKEPSSNSIYIDKGFHEENPGPKPRKEDFPIQPRDTIEPTTFGYYTGPLSMDSVNYNMEAYNEAVHEWTEKKRTYRPLTKKVDKTTLNFNPETDRYERPEDEGLYLKTTQERKAQKEALIQKSTDERIERANAQPDSKEVSIHRMPNGRYIQGPVTVYKHVDSNGYVKWKLVPPGSAESYLQSFWNIPGSPVLSPALQDYAMELYNTNLQMA